jgi:NADPH-dependent curcumin reductase CurA
VDPYQRGKMNQSSRYRESYKIGEPWARSEHSESLKWPLIFSRIDNSGVAKVLRSENSRLKPGEIVYAFFREYFSRRKPTNHWIFPLDIS